MPDIMDHPIAGRIIRPFPVAPAWLPMFHDYLIIENGILTYKQSMMSIHKDISFNLEDIDKMLLIKKHVSPFEKGGQINREARAGTQVELYLVDNQGKRHMLMLNSLLGRWQKDWNRFLSELTKYFDITIEEES